MNYPIELFHWSGMPNDNVEAVKKILTVNPEYSRQSNAYGDNALFIAVRAGNMNIAKLLIDSKLINLKQIVLNKSKEPDGNILMNCCSESRYELVYHLLSLDSDLFYTINSNGETPLHCIFKDMEYPFFESKFASKLIYNIDLNSEYRGSIYNYIAKSFSINPQKNIYTIQCFVNLLNQKQKDDFKEKLRKYSLEYNLSLDPLLLSIE